MGFPRYEKYKNSGVEWLGEVPEHWEILPLNRVASIVSGYAFPSDDFCDDGVHVLRIGDIGVDGDVCMDTCKSVPDEYLKTHNRFLVQKGELVMAMTGATIGKAGFYMYDEAAFVNQRVCIFKSDKTMNYRFMWYALSSIGYKEHISLTAFGGAQPNISDVGLLSYRLSLATIDEQLSIADFLDRETAKIDDLIAEQQKLIELLKEKRQAVISHAVTKGLNPDAKMKDSGIEWLGEVPEHWEIVSLKHLVSIPITDGPHETPVKYDEGIPFVSAEALSQGYINFDKIWGYISEEDNKRFSKRYSPKTNDILVVKLGATTGTVALVSNPIEFNIWVPLAGIRVKSVISPKFIFYLLKSSNVQDAIKLSWTYGTQQTLGLKTLENFHLPMPSLNEQNRIIQFIESEMPKIDALIAISERTISLLKERRTALISAAVTGKIDVRGFVSESENGVAA